MTINFSTIDPTCFGSANGTIFTTVTGGTAPYTYLWSNGKTTKNINLLQAGIYGVVVTDTNNDSVTDEVELFQPTALTLIANVTPNGDNFDVLLDANGGTPNYLYNRTGDTVYQANPLYTLPSGTYIFKVKDANGCIKSIIKKLIKKLD
jgi:hypothetical protein